MLIADCYLLLDSIISIVVLRFWGEQSFTNYQWHPIANLAASILLVASPFVPLNC
jgi:hypothetical protein